MQHNRGGLFQPVKGEGGKEKEKTRVEFVGKKQGEEEKRRGGDERR